MAEQLTFAEESQEYRDFVDKFKPKKTTDDCYTPQNIYDVVLDWASKEYGFDPSKAVRPFWPGGDFERLEYAPDAVVVDNPPFSIVTKICRWYCERGIRFFLFAPYLANFNIGNASPELCHVIVDSNLTYENGAVVATSFVTNLDAELRIRSAPELYMALKEADDANLKKVKAPLSKYVYPHDVVMAAMVGRYSKLGIDYCVRKDECVFLSALDSQKAAKKKMFGGGYLLTKAAAAERAAAERAAAKLTNVTVLELSDRERAIQAMLGGD